MKLDWRGTHFWGAVFYLLVAAALFITLMMWMLPHGLDCSSSSACISTLRSLVLLAAFVALSALVLAFFAKAWDWSTNHNGGNGSAAPGNNTDKALSYPHGATRPMAWVVFFWLVVALSGMFVVFWDPWNLAQRESGRIYEMLLAVFSAGAGSSVATIMAYLRHASRNGDFNYAYVPWYLMRPLLGSLLGLIFYFLMRGGIIAILESPPEQDNLDDLALAGISSLVGLFSNEAYMKLQEVFNTLFRSEKDPAPQDKP